VNGKLRALAWSWLAAGCVLSPAIGLAGVTDEAAQAADSLAAAIDLLEPADLPAALAWLEGDADDAVDGGDGNWCLSARTTATGNRGDLVRRDDRSELRLRGGGSQGPTGGVALSAGGIRVLAGDAGLHAGYGLLLSGPGRWAGLTSPGDGQGGFQAGLHPGAAERRTTRGVVVAVRAGPGDFTVWKGRARDAEAAPRVGAALACAGGHGRAALAFAAAGAGRGGSLSAAWTAGVLSLAGEAALWRARVDGPQRAAWAASGRWRAGRRAAVDVQVAAARPGPAPRTGQRPAALAADDGRGWLVRLRRRWDAVTVVAACGDAEHEGWSDGAPRVTSVRRWSLEGGGGAARCAWGAGLSGRSEQQRGWAGRMPWLPPDLLSTRDAWRASAWLETASGSWRGRLGWRTVRTSTRDGDGADGDDRAAVSLAIGATPTDGIGWRFVQVWAWGGGADLLSVESPAPGILLPRHWGLWRDERTLGLHWRRGDAVASASVACRRPQRAGDAAVYEVRAAATLGWRGF
jgi:hypothetical protein